MGKARQTDRTEPVAAAPPPVEVEQGLRALDEQQAQSPAPVANFLSQDPQLVEDFLVESREHLTNIEARLLEIEQGSATQETLNSAFRSFHTIKGLAGFLDYAVIQTVAHEVESLLDLARNGNLTLTPPKVDVVLQSGDYLGSWLNAIDAAQKGRAVSAPPPPADLLSRVRAAASNDAESVIPLLDGDSSDDAPAGIPALAAALDQEPAADDDALVAEPLAAAPTTAAPAPQAQAASQGQKPASESSLVKVDTSKLEYLVDMVGELVIAQSMLRHNPAFTAINSPRLQRDVTHLTRVTAEVQKTAMAMRMVPIGQLFRRMTRLVRDLARKSGKLAELEMHGEDVELDRTIVEELADPMVHMLRNSMDHGLEMPAEREAAGKPASGRVRLSASHQAGMIVIEIADDGRGLDRQRILRKAVERGLVGADASLSDNEIYHLIFEPGFSTAEKVTDVSGRGVGMDVVRKHITKLRGRIDIVSERGQGTTFFLKLPLTLAIIEGLVVAVGGERFIVPIFSVREMFKPAPESVFTVEGRGEMVMVRERLLPVIRLDEKLGVGAVGAAPRRETHEGLMIVGESANRTFCLRVDELVGKQEVVIKSLGPIFRDVRGLAGGAILGDGRVGLILDLTTLAGDTGAALR